MTKKEMTAQEQSKIMFDSTEEMIDQDFLTFATFLEGRNIGELKAFRTLLQMHFDKANLYAEKLVNNSPQLIFNATQRAQVGSVFGILSKIIDRMSYIDYLIKKNSIK